jgi:hypothetical protein
MISDERSAFNAIPYANCINASDSPIQDHANEVAFTSTKKASIRSGATAPRPRGCRWPHLVHTELGVCWKRCNRPKCCRECRDGWAWKHALAVFRGVEDRQPTHFMTIHCRVPLRDAEFSKAVSALFRLLRRRVPGGLEYLVVNEWRFGVRHAHALLRTGSKLTRKTLQEVRRVVLSLRFTCKRIRNVRGAIRYVFKHTRRPERKAELPPTTFRCRMSSASQRFLAKPFNELCREIREPWRSRCLSSGGAA